MNYPSDEQIAEMVRQLTQARIDNWLVETIGSWRWWTLAILLIAPWFIWYKLADKKRFPELALFGLIVMVFSITLDEIGYNTSFWYYPVQVTPLFPRLTTTDYTVVPITYMLTYQYFPSWKSFFWAIVTVSVVFSFIADQFSYTWGFTFLLNGCIGIHLSSMSSWGYCQDG